MVMPLGLLLCALGQAPSVTLVFGGDVIPHDPVKYAAKAHGRFTLDGDDAVGQNNEGWDHVFGPLSEYFRRNDVAVVNLETPVGYFKKPETGEMVFHAEPSLLRGLKASGVTVATFANNHCLDQHREGITSTRTHLKEVGLLTAGADTCEVDAWKPLILERNGLRIGILPFTRFLNYFHNSKVLTDPQVPLVHYDDDRNTGGHTEAELLQFVKAAAAQVDALIVIPHWGEEYKTQPRPDDRKLAQAILDAGALAIIGMHPHVLQPTEKMIRADGVPSLVAFSLGNLVSNQDFSNLESLKRDGLMLEVTLTRTATGPRISRVNAIALHTENRMSPGKKRNIQPLVLEVEIAALTERLAELGDRTTPEVAAEKKLVQQRLTQMQQRQLRVFSTIQNDVLMDTWH